MDKKILQHNILETTYNSKQWQEVMQEYFDAKKFHLQPKSISLPSNDLAESAVELGSFNTIDERLVGIYEVKLKPKAWVEVNRVGLRNLLRQVYKYDVDAALIVFVQGDKWRFSYVSEIRTEDGKNETEPKRYTYLFGKGETCRTAADRFDKLKGKPIYLNDLFDAFSVDKLNKDFFKSYKEFFESFSDHLAKNKSYRKIILGSSAELEKGWKDQQAKPIRDFSKKLLGRIVFLQFLQKKGWMGVPITNKNWVGGDAKFLQNLFLSCTDQTHFHSKVLKSLFFETLNTKRTNQLAPSIIGKNKKIPYLNGGLFDKDISFENDIDFPADYFKNLLEFFEQYNFTIDENDPYDSEVGIDPEMLGHIFENLLEENREKGAFYTPKEIVHYMCQESLIEYLHTQLPDYAKEDFETLVRNNELAKTFTQHKTANEINNKLKAVKICDPAIGSGAFPMGLLKEIFECRRLLYGYLRTNESFNPALVKKEIIQQNIYGVDLEQGAVEIARLRFWLALVVDEIEPQPLPNLDYKIMQGNSLLERFEGIDLSNLAEMEKEETFLMASKGQFELGAEFSLKKQSLLMFDAKSKEQLYELINDYYGYDETDNEKYPNKQFIKNEINRIVEGKLIAKFYLEKPKMEKQIADKNKQIATNKILKKDPPGIKAKKTKNLEKLGKELATLEKEADKLNAIIEQLHELQMSNDKPYFLWHLWFKDVFDKGGFDIVIGNPPYGTSIKNEYREEVVENLGKVPDFEIYYYFFELAKKLLKDKGALTYITPNTFLFNVFAKNYRLKLLDEWNVKFIVDCSAFKIFENATVINAVFLFEMSLGDNLVGYKNTKHSTNFLDLIQSPTFFIDKNYLINNNQNWGLAFKLNQEALKLISKIGNKKRLKDYVPEISQGLIAYDKYQGQSDNIIKSRAYHYDKPKRGLKKWLWGEDVTWYNVSWNQKEYIDYCNGIANPRDPKFFRGERILIREITNPKIYAAFTEEEMYNDPSILIILKGTSINLKYLLAIFNSKLATYYHFNSSPKATKGAFPKILIEDLKNFPIPEIDKKKQILFSNLVDQILAAKKANPQANTLSIENEIDVMVYKLYDLTYEEVLVVDKDFDMSKEAYNKKD